MSEIMPLGRLLGTALDESAHTQFHDMLVEKGSKAAGGYFDHPHSVYLQPVFESFSDSSRLVGVLVAVVTWDRYFANILPDGVDGITAVLRNTCGQAFTYVIMGHAVRGGRGLTIKRRAKMHLTPSFLHDDTLS